MKKNSRRPNSLEKTEGVGCADYWRLGCEAGVNSEDISSHRRYNLKHFMFVISISSFYHLV
jgi:hypothetical protein